MRALEHPERAATESPIRTEAQLAALEKAKGEKEAHGECEREGSG